MKLKILMKKICRTFCPIFVNSRKKNLWYWKEIHRLEFEESLKSPEASLWILLFCELSLRSIVMTTSALVSFRKFSKTATLSINQPHVFLFRRGILSNVFFSLLCIYPRTHIKYDIVQHSTDPGQTLHYDMLFYFVKWEWTWQTWAYTEDMHSRNMHILSMEYNNILYLFGRHMRALPCKKRLMMRVL